MTKNSAEPPMAVKGYDGPVTDRNGDILKRWPLAREIYGIATTGPKEWSVRIGIYGEWGTGKTSVLKFISSIAEHADNVVIWFDPWEYSAKADLWREFVLAVFKKLESKLGHVPGAKQAKTKVWINKAKGVVSGVTSAINSGVGKALDTGLELIKEHFSFSEGDLKSLQSILGEKRVIILIDDLDRTAPELVPEILFALKELMDIPGFSFICAFDPIVVGQVLGKFHRGFEDGLKFLDKIIDYPRWLPPPSLEGLTDLALAEAKLSCDYVPISAIQDAIPMLPANPRTIRQFIRLLALLKPQIQRHNDDELNWRTIIAANVLKIRYPRVAHALLNDGKFWEQIAVIGLGLEGKKYQASREEVVEDHIKKTSDKNGITLEALQQGEIKAALLALCSQANPFAGTHGESIAYQANIAEVPAAVTWKEFEAFFKAWKQSQVAGTIEIWIESHVQQVDASRLDIYRELLVAAVQRYAQILQQADFIYIESEKPALVGQAASLFMLLNSLVFDFGKLTEPKKQIGDAELELLVAKFASFTGSGLPVHKEFQARNEEFITKLFEHWGHDVMPLMHALNPYSGKPLQDFAGESTSELRKKLCKVVLPHLARQIIENFRQSGYIDRLITKEKDTFDMRCMVLDADGPFWSKLRADKFQLLKEAPSNRAVQENAYEILHWFILIRQGDAPGDPQSMVKLLSDQPVFDAIWDAATAKPLAGRGIYQIRKLPIMLQPIGTKFEPPQWWLQAVATFTVPASSSGMP